MDWIKVTDVQPPKQTKSFFLSASGDVVCDYLENLLFVPVKWTTFETIY